MDTFDLICIGCGPAGEKAATQAAYFGRRVAIVEKESVPGGTMVNTGTIPSKALRETALLCSSFRRRPIPGLSLDVQSTVSIHSFMARKNLVQQEEHDRIEMSLDKNGIQVFHGQGRLNGPNTVVVEQADGEQLELQADHILIATGSQPFRPEHLPFDHPAVVDADGILSLGRMPGSIVIVGGGVIGSEYASIFAEMGVRVTLTEPRDHILPFIDDECRELLYRSMEDVEVDLRLNTSVKDATGETNGGVSVELDNGETLHADVLLWAAGRNGNTGGLGLETVGLESDKRGLLAVNKQYQTEVPSIYAAGDVIGPPALASTSMEQGRVAVCHMFNLDFKRSVAELVPIGIYTVPCIAMIGLSEVQANDAGRGFVVGRASSRFNARGRMLGDDHGMMKLIFDRETGALLGASIIGTQATELIHFAHPAIVSGEGIEYFIDMCFNYPSLTELYKYAAYDALQALADGRTTARKTPRDARAA